MVWFNNSWKYRKKVTINSSQISGTLTDFTTYLDLSLLGSDFFNNVNSDGSDIRITQSDETTQCAVHVVSIDTLGETGRINFKAPSVSSSTDTDFYIYYGNSGASLPITSDTYGQYNTYKDEYKIYYGMDTGSGSTLYDYTSNSNDGVINGATWTSGNVGKNALDFDGTNDYVERTSVGISSNNFTITGLFNAGLISYHSIFTDFNSVGNRNLIYIINGEIIAYNVVAGTYNSISQSINANELYHFAYVRNGNQFHLYLNGVLVGSQTYTNPTSPTTMRIGARGDVLTKHFFNGVVDEFKILSTGLTMNEISSDFNNLVNQNLFFTIAAQEVGILTNDFNALELNLTSENLDFTSSLTNDLENLDLNVTSETLDFTSSLTNDLNNLDLNVTSENIDFTSSLTNDLDNLDLNITSESLDFTSSLTNDLDNLDLNITSESLTFEEVGTLTNDFNALELNLTSESLDFTSSLTNDLDNLDLNITSESLDFTSSLTNDLDNLDLNITSESLNNVARFDVINEFNSLELSIVPNNLSIIEIDLDVNINLENSRKDFIQVIDEAGEEMIYRKLKKEYYDDGKIKGTSVKEYVIKGLLEDDIMERVNDNSGEHIEGETKINLPYKIISGGEEFYPRINDEIQIKETNIKYRIKSIQSMRLFGGVVDNDCKVERITFNDLDYED